LVTGSNGTGAYVYKTIDGGSNWTQVFFQPGGFINVIDINPFTINGEGFMQGDPVGGRWSLWKTTNKGSTWDSSGLYLPQSGSEAGWNNSGFRDDNDMFTFGTNNNRIYRTTNDGNTWSIQPTPDLNSYSLWFNQFTVNGVSGGSQIMTTNNGGSNWQNQTAPGTGNVTGIVGAKNQF